MEDRDWFSSLKGFGLIFLWEKSHKVVMSTSQQISHWSGIHMDICWYYQDITFFIYFERERISWKGTRSSATKLNGRLVEWSTRWLKPTKGKGVLWHTQEIEAGIDCSIHSQRRKQIHQRSYIFNLGAVDPLIQCNYSSPIMHSLIDCNYSPNILQSKVITHSK